MNELRYKVWDKLTDFADRITFIKIHIKIYPFWYVGEFLWWVSELTWDEKWNDE